MAWRHGQALSFSEPWRATSLVKARLRRQICIYLRILYMFSIIIHVYDIRRRFIRRGGTYKPWSHGAPWRSHGEPFRTVIRTEARGDEEEKG